MTNKSVETISNRLFKKNMTYPTTFSIIGGLLSNPITNFIIGSTIVWNPILYPIGINSIISLTGCSLGWLYGRTIEDIESFNNLIINDQCWKIINEKIEMTEDIQEYNKYIVGYMITNCASDIGKLYIFCTTLFIERYEYIETNTQLMNEFRQMVALLSLKHPMYTKEKYSEIKDSIERIALNDLYSYIHSSYLITHKNDYNNIDKNFDFYYISKHTTSEVIENTILTACKAFKLIPYISHPKDKIDILIKMIQNISDELEKQGILMSCDELTPIICEIIIRNIDIIPNAEIQMIYDYMGDKCDENGYVATVLMVCLSSLNKKIK